MNAIGFGRLDEADVARLSGASHEKAVARREVVPLDAPMLAIVVSGYFRVFRHAAFVRDVTLGLAAPGDVLAPDVAFGRKPVESGAEALADGKLLLISADGWNAAADADPALSLKMAASIAKRVHRAQKRIEELSRATAEGRVAGALVDLADDFGAAAEGGTRLDLPLSQDDLARLAGTTRETTSSVVADFARRGWVSGGRLRGLLVVRRDELERLAQAGLS